MALTEEQNTRLTEILEALKLELDKLPPASKNFVQDQIKRHEQYDNRMFISTKQTAWLEDLYEKYAGGVKVAKKAQDDDYGPDDDNPPPIDEVPF